MELRYLKFFIFNLLLLLGINNNELWAQNIPSASSVNNQKLNFGEPDLTGSYVIEQVTIRGAKFADTSTLKAVSGLQKGMVVTFPYDANISKAITVLWNQGMFANVNIAIDKVIDQKLYLAIEVEERPRLTSFTFTGVNKTQEEEIKTKTGLMANRMITDAMKQDLSERIKIYFAEKGYNNATVNVIETPDNKMANGASLKIMVNKGQKVKINLINFEGNEQFTQAKLKRAMKGTKEMAILSLYPANKFTVYQKPDRTFKSYINNGGPLSLSKTLDHLNPYFRYGIFSASKFEQKKYNDDKSNIIEIYNTAGYRDAQIKDDTVYRIDNGHLNVELKLEEGNKYYFGKINWKGNTLYSDSLLSELLGIKKGDTYNKELLNNKIQGRATVEGGIDVGSIYLNNGYLGYRAEAIEKEIRNDTIDFDIIVNEGPQFKVKNINIIGNDRTNDYVLRREMYIYPGSIYNQSDLIRSIRQISQLGFIDPQKVSPEPKVNQQDKTVDIDFRIAEKSNDQLELSAGYGGGIGFTGTLGLTFNNFSLKNMLKPSTWAPLPMGDGQKLSIRYQSSGLWYNSLSFSFTEPWVGGKKPIALNLGVNYGRYATAGYGYNIMNKEVTPNDYYIRNWGGSISLSKRLLWPDNNFVASVGLEFMNFKLKDYQLLPVEVPEYRNGYSNNLALRLTIARNTLDQPLFPKSGSSISLSVALTPPVSLFNDKDYSYMTAKERYSWVEYHKYKFNADWYQKIAGNFVLRLSAKMGFMGMYNKNLGFSPFERFQVGGDGLSGFNYFAGKDIVSLRGYDVFSTNNEPNSYTIFNKFTAEVRYPFSLNPEATIFGLAFFESGNGYNSIKDYNPLKMYRSVGLGVRVFLPMFGLLGLDYGVGIDNLYQPNGLRNSLGAAAKFTFMLGQEPQ
ncbi:MAG TPA: POTRA domain-containing protein [Edaphocola sp.]|nr:POTRA domain-containing protein [Edaphocola sp.]